MFKILILFFISFACFSQPYVSFSADANKIFNLKDNSRTVIDHKGLDFDLEVGAIDKNVSVYVFYGGFPNANYSNYGVGVDFIIKPFKSLYLSIGNYYSKTMRHGKYHYLGGAISYFNPRGKITYFINDNIGIDLISKFQYRGDLDKRIFEG